VAKVVETQSNLERQLELIETHQQEVFLKPLFSILPYFCMLKELIILL